MEKLLRIAAIVLLMFNGVNALVGGFMMIVDPSGGKMQLPLSYLEHAPFSDFLVPGIVLFIANGLFSVAVVIAVFYKYRLYCQLIMVQGAILLGWILVQVLMVQQIFFLHYLMGSIGLLLIILGQMLTHKMRVKRSALEKK